MSFGPESIFKVEARALLESLFFAWDKGFRKVEVECDDDSLLVDLVTSSGGINSSLIEVRLLHRHISMSLNGIADHMARVSMPSEGQFRVFQALSPSIMHLLDNERKGLLHC